MISTVSVSFSADDVLWSHSKHMYNGLVRMLIQAFSWTFSPPASVCWPSSSLWNVRIQLSESLRIVQSPSPSFLFTFSATRKAASFLISLSSASAISRQTATTSLFRRASSSSVNRFCCVSSPLCSASVIAVSFPLNKKSSISSLLFSCIFFRNSSKLPLVFRSEDVVSAIFLPAIEQRNALFFRLSAAFPFFERGQRICFTLFTCYNALIDSRKMFQTAYLSVILNAQAKHYP